MAYAVIKTGGKQYRVQEGTTFDVEKLDAAVDSEIKFDALLVGEGETVKIGAPIVEGASVTAKVSANTAAPRELPSNSSAARDSTRPNGFRRSLTTLEVTSIAG